MKIKILKASCWADEKLLEDGKLKPLAMYREQCGCITEKFTSLGEAVEWMIRNVYPNLIVDTREDVAEITIYDDYVE